MDHVKCVSTINVIFNYVTCRLSQSLWVLIWKNYSFKFKVFRGFQHHRISLKSVKTLPVYARFERPIHHNVQEMWDIMTVKRHPDRIHWIDQQSRPPTLHDEDGSLEMFNNAKHDSPKILEWFLIVQKHYGRTTVRRSSRWSRRAVFQNTPRRLEDWIMANFSNRIRIKAALQRPWTLRIETSSGPSPRDGVGTKSWVLSLFKTVITHSTSPFAPKHFACVLRQVELPSSWSGRTSDEAAVRRS